jgi:hypothetical protein
MRGGVEGGGVEREDRSDSAFVGLVRGDVSVETVSVRADEETP